MNNKSKILFINMAKGFGGGEFYTEQLIRHLDGYECYFFGKSSGKLAEYIKQTIPNVTVVNFLQLIRLCFLNRNMIIHALDGRGAHIANGIKRIFKNPTIITRQVNFPFKRESSKKAYKNADMLVGVSRKITEYLVTLNPHSHTIYGCLKPLQENQEFEQQYFSQKKAKLDIAQIGNFQTVKNFPLTIELARKNQDVHFYLVGSGELEIELKKQAENLNNITFIPFTPYIGSVLKNVDLLIMPSHSEGLGQAILESYQYKKAVIANAVGGIPEIVEHNVTGFLVEKNELEHYQRYLDKIKHNPEILKAFSNNIQIFLENNDFSAYRMAREYREKYEFLFINIK